MPAFEGLVGFVARRMELVLRLETGRPATAIGPIVIVIVEFIVPFSSGHSCIPETRLRRGAEPGVVDHTGRIGGIRHANTAFVVKLYGELFPQSKSFPFKDSVA
jgi:hypothetical protein